MIFFQAVHLSCLHLLQGRFTPNVCAALDKDFLLCPSLCNRLDFFQHMINFKGHVRRSSLSRMMQNNEQKRDIYVFVYYLINAKILPSVQATAFLSRSRNQLSVFSIIECTIQLINFKCPLEEKGNTVILPNTMVPPNLFALKQYRSLPSCCPKHLLFNMSSYSL